MLRIFIGWLFWFGYTKEKRCAELERIQKGDVTYFMTIIDFYKRFSKVNVELFNQLSYVSQIVFMSTISIACFLFATCFVFVFKRFL
jgi:hypothetical protein